MLLLDTSTPLTAVSRDIDPIIKPGDSQFAAVLAKATSGKRRLLIHIIELRSG